MAEPMSKDEKENPSILMVSNNTPIGSVKLDGPKTYLVWSRQCTVALKARGLMGYVTGKKPQSKESNSSFDNWDQQNSQTMSLLYASLDPTLVASYVLYETAAQLWKAIKLTYSQTGNYAGVRHSPEAEDFKTRRSHSG